MSAYCVGEKEKLLQHITKGSLMVFANLYLRITYMIHQEAMLEIVPSPCAHFQNLENT